MKVSIYPSWLQTAIATANKLPAFNKKENMFKNKETVFYLFLVMVICEFCYSGLVCCGFFGFFVLSTILVNKDAYNIGLLRAKN